MTKGELRTLWEDPFWTGANMIHFRHESLRHPCGNEVMVGYVVLLIGRSPSCKFKYDRYQCVWLENEDTCEVKKGKSEQRATENLGWGAPRSDIQIPGDEPVKQQKEK